MRKFIAAAGAGLVVGLLAVWCVPDAAATDNCPTISGVVWARNAQRTAGGGPLYCRLSQCKPPGAYAQRTHAAIPQGIVFDWQYTVRASTAPTSYCSADVEAGGNSGWHY